MWFFFEIIKIRIGLNKSLKWQENKENILQKKHDTIVRMHVVEKQTRVKIASCVDLSVNEVGKSIKNHFNGK